MGQKEMVYDGSQDGPKRLVVSVVLAFFVMLFINGFIGSMGGMPAFLAFLMVFYLTRTRAVRQWQEQENGRKETLGLFVGFSLGYLLIWSILRVLMTISRVTGWGNLSGASAVAFIRELFRTSVLEKSSYLAAWILMFTFVLSLFPLAAIKSRRNWTVYALVDSAGFALVCLGIGWISSLASDNPTEARAVCLIDQFLLCREFALWQDLLVLFFLFILMSMVGFFSFWFAYRDIRKSSKGAKSGQRAEEKENKRYVNLAVILCCVAATAVVAGIVLLMPEDTTEGYGKVAEFLTEDSVLGPMEYGGRIYVPVDEKLTLDETGTPQGYLVEKDENCDSRFYRLAVANILYSDKSCETDHVQMKGRKKGSFAPVETVEPVEEEHPVYVLWDEEWEKESAYSHEPTGYTVCNEGVMEGLSMQFGEVTYRPLDFEDYDAYFTIRAYASMDDFLVGEAVSGQWAGCILVKDDKFYYGSYDNQITGICLQQLREVLGGNPCG